jgi:hypothetical protein
LAGADDEVSDACGHDQIANAHKGGVAEKARDGKNIAHEPEALRVLKQDVKWV